ncbi:MAG: peptide chain release factor 2 [Dehalococcoidia bacterium]
MEELLQELEALSRRIDTIMVRLDIAAKDKEALALEAQSAAPDFWDDPQPAQQLMRRMSDLRSSVEPWQSARKRATDLMDLVALVVEEGDESLAGDVTSEAAQLAKDVDALEFELMLGGEYDDHGAILTVHAGAGGTESQDWAEMLFRMFLRWAERHGDSVEVLNVMPGEEAGVKSATIEVSGRQAYGYLRSERGVHRLVRLSPFDSAHARHTSFALVEVMPVIEEELKEIEISPDDLRVDVFNASGHGGQNVQKNATAIRITHLPTGKVVTCQNERSQHRNRESAMKVLKGWLVEQELERKADEKAKLKGQHVSAGWSNQIRSYVLHPYKLVKDLRSGYETSDPNTVLDGDLDAIMRAYLQWDIGNSGGAAA